jgi:hypothetical protein
VLAYQHGGVDDVEGAVTVDLDAVEAAAKAAMLGPWDEAASPTVVLELVARLREAEARPTTAELLEERERCEQGRIAAARRDERERAARVCDEVNLIMEPVGCFTAGDLAKAIRALGDAE